MIYGYLLLRIIHRTGGAIYTKPSEYQTYIWLRKMQFIARTFIYNLKFPMKNFLEVNTPISLSDNLVQTCNVNKVLLVSDSGQ